MSDLFDSVVNSDRVWRGASRFLYAASGTSFPGKLESVIQPSSPNDPDATAYALGTSWNDFGGTGTEGIEIVREFEGQAGIEVDQIPYDLFEGDPTKWSMRVSGTLKHTDPATLAIGWELPSTVSIAADDTGPDYKVAQTKVKFSAPTSLTERLLAVVQEHPDNGNLRVFVFRKAKLTPAARALAISASDGSELPIEFDCKADTTIDSDEDPFGALYREDTS